jgi:hypothetical protein
MTVGKAKAKTDSITLTQVQHKNDSNYYYLKIAVFKKIERVHINNTKFVTQLG